MKELEIAKKALEGNLKKAEKINKLKAEMDSSNFQVCKQLAKFCKKKGFEDHAKAFNAFAKIFKNL